MSFAGDASAEDVISSPSNRVVKYVRSLQKRSVRDQERAFVVEGALAVADAVAAGAVPLTLLLRAGIAARVVGRRDATRVVTPALFDALAETQHPQGILAVVSKPDLSVPDEPAPLWLILDGIRDPGNMGTLLRSAAAAGATAVAITPGSVDAYNAKTVRAGMGAHFRIPILAMNDGLNADIRERCPLRVLADLGPYPPHDEVDWCGACAMIIASETGGPSAEAAALATGRACIPMRAGVESLNAAMAGTVMLFEAARQRRSPG